MSTADLYVLAYLLMNIVQQTMWYVAFQMIFPARIPPRCYYPLVILMNTAISLTIYYLLTPYLVLRMVLSNAFFGCTLLLLHRGNLLRRLLAVLSVFLTMALTEMTVLLPVPSLSLYIQHRDLCHPELIPFYFAFLFTQAFYLLLMVCCFRFLDKKNDDRVSARDQLYYVLFPINQFVLLSIWFYYYVFTAPLETFTPKKITFLVVIILSCILTDVLLFRLISRTAENAGLRARNELMEEQIAVKAEYYRLTAQNYSTMRQMRHDIANHICTIRAMLQSGDQEASQRYIAELENTTAVRSLLSDCQNAAVDAFLRERSDSLSSQNIPLSLDVHLPSSCFVSDVDLITALGNLLDNAADACRQTGKPYICLKAALSDGFLHIETENSCPPKRTKKERRISYMERGTGFHILSSLAEKYGGSFTSHADGSVYNTTLVLKESPHGQHLPV